MSRKNRRQRRAEKAALSKSDASDLPSGARMRNLDAQAVEARARSLAPVQKPGGSQWFGPGEPIDPMAPPDVMGRQWDFLVGENLTITPRAHEGVSYFEMRALADAYDVLRLVIETRKDQMQRLEWSLVPRTMADGSTLKPSKSDVQEITDFLERPDGVHDWGTWQRMLLEEMFVTDAAALYPNRTRGGELLGLELIDGTTFKRIIDNWGRTPSEPNQPAYQQILHGLPAVDYLADDLIYVPRNPRVSRIYGYSPVEQIITTVNIALRKQLFMLQYFTDGTMPEAIIGISADWTPDQIAKFQTNWDTMLSGNTAARRRVKFVPAGTGSSYHPSKEPDLAGKTDEWLARVVCYAFSVPPTPFVPQVNRATAQSAHDAAIEEGLAPIQKWMANIVNSVIRTYWPKVTADFAWKDDREVDPQVQSVVITTLVAKGVKSINEGRDEYGLPPVDGGDVPMALTGTGYVPIDGSPPPNAPPPPEMTAPPPSKGSPAGAAASGGADGGSASNGKDGSIDGKGAPAAKGAGNFRRVADLKKRTYWGPPRRAVAPNAGGDAG